MLICGFNQISIKFQPLIAHYLRLNKESFCNSRISQVTQPSSQF
jgi:hypothetical protein